MQQHSQATAREMLNEMIKESATKYDKEITKCASFYASHCSFMEIARSQLRGNYLPCTDLGCSGQYCEKREGHPCHKEGARGQSCSLY